MNIIKANNINHSYIFAQREIKSLYDISFKIEKGEFISIVGMNGCGKSTLVKHLNALIPLQSGELTIASLDCRNNKNIYKIRQKCCRVFQNPDNQLQIELKEEVAQGTYANLAIITHSSSEFVLDFVRVLPGLPKAGVQSRVILAPEHAKRLQRALEENIAKYERAFGPIRLQEDGVDTPPILDIKGEA